MFLWYLRNVRLRADFFDLEKENYFPTRKNKYMKIDGFMAMMDAYCVLKEQQIVYASDYGGKGIISARLW